MCGSAFLFYIWSDLESTKPYLLATDSEKELYNQEAKYIQENIQLNDYYSNLDD